GAAGWVGRRIGFDRADYRAECGRAGDGDADDRADPNALANTDTITHADTKPNPDADTHTAAGRVRPVLRAATGSGDVPQPGRGAVDLPALSGRLLLRLSGRAADGD